MKIFCTAFFAALFILIGTACNRHSISETLPGYEEHQYQADDQKELARVAHPVKVFSEEKKSVD